MLTTGTGLIISTPERWDGVGGFVPEHHAHPPPQHPSKMWLFLGLRVVLNTLDLVKKRRGCLKAKLYCKAEGARFQGPHPPSPSPSALLRGKERFFW